MFRQKIGALFLLMVAAGVVWFAITNIQLIGDYTRYYQFKPNETIASFVELTGMNKQGEFLFYASHPVLADAATFNSQCEKKEETTAVLGCYDGVNIYIYDVPDDRLAGIRPTTAAHEMLHAAFKRLNSDEKSYVERLLEDEYEKLLEDEELSGRMAFYAVTQPGDRTNELHSIIGTEIASISAELEQYYKKYFSDRSKVITQHRQYHSIFKELKAKAEALNRQIQILADAINSKRASYNQQIITLQKDIATFNARAERGDFESQEQFNRERQSLLLKSGQLDSLRSEINNNIATYNSLVSELNGIATETEALNRSIDSTLEPAPRL